MIEKWLGRVSIIFLLISMVLVPLVGSIVIPYSFQIFLIVATLFCVTSFAYLISARKFLYTVRKGIWYVLFLATITLISTWKYAMELKNGQETTFFTVYQIVIFAIYGFMIFGLVLHQRKILPILLGLLNIINVLLIIVYRRHFLFDMGVLRFMGAYPNPNILGIYTITAFFSSLYLLFSHMPLKILWIVNGAFSVAAILLTASRTAVISTFAGLLIIVIFSMRKIRQIHWKQLFITVVIFFLVLGFAFLLLRPTTMENLVLTVGSDLSLTIPDEEILDASDEEINEPPQEPSNVEDEITSSDNEMAEMWNRFLNRFMMNSDGKSSIKHNLRLQIWVEYLRTLPKYFVIGTDNSLVARPILFGEIRDPHNTLIYTMFRYGIFGFIFLVLMLVIINVRLLHWRKKHKNVAIQAMLISLMVISLLNDLLNIPLFFAIIGFSYVVSLEKTSLASIPEQPKRVLQVFSSLNKGGAESRMMDIFRRLDKEKVVFDFAVTSDNAEKHFYYNEVLTLGGKVFSVTSWRSIGIVEYFNQWSEMIQENNYRIVHCHAGAFSALPMYISWLNNVPMRIAHARNSSADNKSVYSKRVNRLITNVFSNTRIYCSKEAAEFAFGDFSYKRFKTYFLPNAIDVSQFVEITAEQKLVLQQSLEIKPGDYVIGTVGNARPVKNHIFLVKVFHEFLKKHPESTLIIVGDDEGDAEAKNYVYENNFAEKVIFTGIRADVNDLLQIFDVFVLPSVREGAPGSVIEAQAVNVPCVLSDTITREVDMNLGLVSYVPLNATLDVWMDEILRCCNMQRPAFGEAAFKLKEMGYDNSNSTKILLHIYGL